MPTGATGQLGLALPVQGELSGTWGNTVNNAITEYTNIAIAATLTLTNDGAVTLANTTGTDLATNITSSLTGAGTVTAQFAIVRVTGTLTTAKVVTAPSYSKTYTVVNAATGGVVTFKASGQTGVSIAVGESAFVYFNGTDYVKLAGTATAGAAAGSNTQVQYNSSGALAGSANFVFDGTNVGVGTSSPTFISGGGLEVYNSSVSRLKLTNSTTGTASTDGLDIHINSTDANIVVRENFPLIVYTNNAERMRITAAGDVGIGTSSPLGILDVRSTSPNVLINGKDTADPDIYFGRYQFAALSQSGAKIGYVYGSASGAQEYGSLTFSTATTAFGAITERMRINASGNVGIGTSSPSSKLQVGATSDSSVAMSNSSSVTSGNRGTIYMYNSADSTVGAIRFGAVTDNVGTNIQFYTRPVAGSLTQSMTLTEDGNLGIGSVGAGNKFTVSNGGANGFEVDPLSASGAKTKIISINRSGSAYTPFQYDASLHEFQTSGTERARISAAGGFSVGTTSDPGAGAIYATGNITAFFSDKRLKTVSGKIENALDKVAKLSGVYYTFNDTAKSFGYDSDEEQVGVIAQEVEAVLPQIVKAAPFDLDENNNSKSGENYKTVQYDKLVPLLIEAINELRAEVKALKGE